MISQLLSHAERSVAPRRCRPCPLRALVVGSPGPRSTPGVRGALQLAARGGDGPDRGRERRSSRTSLHPRGARPAQSALCSVSTSRSSTYARALSPARPHGGDSRPGRKRDEGLLQRCGRDRRGAPPPRAGSGPATSAIGTRRGTCSWPAACWRNINRGGVKIAPREIDELLAAHPAILEAAAVGVPHPDLGEDAIAYVALRPGPDSVREDELSDLCERELGHFKAPTRIHVIERLPRGPSGKVDRLRLIEDAGQRARGGGRRASIPAAAARRVPRPPDPGGADHREELERRAGPASASGFTTTSSSWVEAHWWRCESWRGSTGCCRCSLSLGSFLDHPTIAEQAALVDRELLGAAEAARLLAEVEALPEDGGDAAVIGRERRVRRRPGRVTDELSSRLDRLSPAKRALLERLLLGRLRASTPSDGIPPRDPSRPCPLSPLQERIWFLEQLHPRMPVYHEPSAARLRGPLDLKALKAALRRHPEPATRSCGWRFDWSTGCRRQVFHPSRPGRARRGRSVRPEPREERESAISDALREEATRPFDLQSDPPLRAMVLRAGRGGPRARAHAASSGAATARRWVCCFASSSSCTRRRSRELPYACRRCPSSSATSRPGSARAPRMPRWRPTLPTGRRSSGRRPPSSTSRPIGPGRPRCPTGARYARSGSGRPCPSASAADEPAPRG